MQNSLLIFSAFIVFLAFGYLSFLRILYQQQVNAPLTTIFAGIFDRQNLPQIGSSAFFVSLPATSLLLFWGWMPALLWLVIFHLLADCLINLQASALTSRTNLARYLIHAQKPTTSLIIRTILQLYLILLISIALNLLAHLIDKESGLLFMLVGLIPAIQLLSNSNSIPKILRQLGALLLIMMSILLASKLGFAIYGDWSPFGNTLSWLRFNNTTIVAAILLVGTFSLANKQSLSDQVAKLAGLVICFIIIVLVVKLIWLSPLIDAPLNSTHLHGANEQPDDLPFFISFCLFLFAGFTALLFRVFNRHVFIDSEDIKTKNSRATSFASLQTISLVQLLVCLVLVLCLASATGIGAWNTHYLDWFTQADLVNHLNLSIASFSALIHSESTTSNLIQTSITAGLCVSGISFLIVCMRSLSLLETSIETPDNSAKHSLKDSVIQSKLIQVILALFLTTYFIENSIPLNIWLLVGIFAWILVAQLITAMTIGMTEASFVRSAYGIQCLILIGIGVLQLVWLSISSFNDGQLIFTIIGVCLLILVISLWWKSIQTIISRFTEIENESVFDLDEP